ncbi:hypothetical protein RF11_01604 [Thelohanellus kitauei]|uniref:Uncharacterized protein n=1 Tax=Thelohanellus kitauei TaxID=669202 RepID=A0A0C2MWK3_THEKT|nr:hypothetical protein RF11_01604 [Thelohanellus kitauei]
MIDQIGVIQTLHEDDKPTKTKYIHLFTSDTIDNNLDNVIDLLAKEEIQINITQLQKDLVEINKKRDQCQKDVLGFKIMLHNMDQEATALNNDVQKYKEWAKWATIFTRWFWRGKMYDCLYYLQQQYIIIDFYYKQCTRFENLLDSLNREASEFEEKIQIYQKLLQS